MGDKVKNLPRRELIPPYLSREERFAFRSPLPLDVCVRRLLAKNDGTYWQQVWHSARTQVSVQNVGMNDQEFVIRLSAGNTAAWAFGTLTDIDGEATWVAGKLGASEDMEILLWVLTALLGAFFLLMLISGPYLFCMGMSVLVMVAAVRDIRYAIHPVRTLMRDAFELDDDGPLPVEEQAKGLDDG